MNKLNEEIQRLVNLEYCPGCGSQRCYGQDEMIEGCYHYKLLVKENEQLRRKNNSNFKKT